MKSLFVLDPLSSLHVEGDSSYVLMRAWCDRGWPLWAVTPDRLYLREGRAFASANELRVSAQPPYFEIVGQRELDLAEVDVVWMRKDPPFDMDYIFATYLLDVAARSTLVVNDPAGLKLYNEKMWAAGEFAALQPPTLVSNRADQLRAFVDAQTRAVLKPWDGNGGRGVVVTARGDRNLGAMIDLLTQEGRAYAIAQAWVPEVETEGDKRIVLFDGVPVGVILRKPSSQDYRANMHVGASVEATELSAADRAICDALGPRLKETGQVFVGIDVIGGFLTEINVTSPTGLRELEALYGRPLEHDLVELVAAKAAAHKGE